MLIRYFHRIRQRFVRYKIYRALLPHFDEVFYRDSNKDLSDCRNLLAHYIDIGWKEARNPARWFSTYTYLEERPDVRDAGINPFYHYIVFGCAEGYSLAGKELDDEEKLRTTLEALLAIFYYEPHLPKSDKATEIPRISSAISIGLGDDKNLARDRL